MIRSRIKTVRKGASRTLPPNFWAPFTDAGSGAVNLTLSRGTGSATFTRATAAAARLSTGLWKVDVASGTARSHYLSDLTYGGYLAEAAATQLVTPSASVRDMTNAAWVKTAMTTALTSTGIDGTANSCTRCTATAGNALILQTLVAAASSRTYSCFIKRVTGTGNIELTQDGVTFTNIATLINSSTFTQVSLNASQLNASFGIRIVTNGDAIDVDWNQFEAGGFATTPIPLAGTRAADVLTYPSAGNAVTAQGTLFCRAMTFNLSAVRSTVGISDASNNNASNLFIHTTGADRGQVQSGGASQADLIHATVGAVNVVQTQSLYWATNLANISINGIPSTADTSVTAPVSFSEVNVGLRGGGALPLNGCIRDIRIWQRVLSDSQIASIR